MSNYLYKTTIFIDTSNLINIDNSQNNIDKLDFETNFKSQSLLIDEIVSMDMSFIISKTYSDFKALIVTPLNWSDIKYIQGGNKYQLFLLI